MVLFVRKNPSLKYSEATELYLMGSIYSNTLMFVPSVRQCINVYGITCGSKDERTDGRRQPECHRCGHSVLVIMLWLSEETIDF